MHDLLDQVIERCDEPQLIAMQIIVNEVSAAPALHSIGT